MYPFYPSYQTPFPSIPHADKFKSGKVGTYKYNPADGKWYDHEGNAKSGDPKRDIKTGDVTAVEPNPSKVKDRPETADRVIYKVLAEAWASGFPTLCVMRSKPVDVPETMKIVHEPIPGVYFYDFAEAAEYAERYKTQYKVEAWVIEQKIVSVL